MAIKEIEVTNKDYQVICDSCGNEIDRNPANFLYTSFKDDESRQYDFHQECAETILKAAV